MRKVTCRLTGLGERSRCCSWLRCFLMKSFYGRSKMRLPTCALYAAHQKKETGPEPLGQPPLELPQRKLRGWRGRRGAQGTECPKGNSADVALSWITMWYEPFKTWGLAVLHPYSYLHSLPIHFIYSCHTGKCEPQCSIRRCNALRKTWEQPNLLLFSLPAIHFTPHGRAGTRWTSSGTSDLSLKNYWNKPRRFALMWLDEIDPEVLSHLSHSVIL